MRDLFFDDFYAELERVAASVTDVSEIGPNILAEDLNQRWTNYTPCMSDRKEVLVSVDGGVQISDFAYGGFVAVARACAIIHHKGEGRRLVKRVKLFADEVYDNRDRGVIPGYVRIIAEYDAARLAAEQVLAEGGRPLILMDGSLYLARFPYAIREYRNHPDLLTELFSSISALRYLARDRGFTVAGVSKDSTVFYLYMMLLRDTLRRAGLSKLGPLLDLSGSPHDLKVKAERISDRDRQALEPFLELRPLCDTALVHTSKEVEGYSNPILLAPGIYYGRETAPSLYARILQNLPQKKAEHVVQALRSFFSCPGVASTVWRPRNNARPFRIDVTADSLGHDAPWIDQKRNSWANNVEALENVLDHLTYWYCNDVEYNIPLKQADQLARFDRKLYIDKYQPFIVRRLEEAGFDIRGSRRMQREMD
jgi:hypothetical protein